MADISQITLPSGTTYNLKDATARSLIDTLSSYSSYLGVTTTALTDGATTTPVTIDGSSVTPVVGSIVNYGSAEFIYNGIAWQEFGDLSALGALAYKDEASGSVTAAGSVSQPTFTGNAVAYTPAGTVTVASYTPAGTVSAPTITTTPTTTSIYSMTGVGTLPSCTLPTLNCTVSDENLTLSWTDGDFSTGTLPTRDSATAVVTSISATASAPTFTGTAKAPTATFSGTEDSIIAAGTISKPTFTGDAVTVTVS